MNGFTDEFAEQMDVLGCLYMHLSNFLRSSLLEQDRNKSFEALALCSDIFDIYDNNCQDDFEGAVCEALAGLCSRISNEDAPLAEERINLIRTAAQVARSGDAKNIKTACAMVSAIKNGQPEEQHPSETEQPVSVPGPEPTAG